MVWKGALIGAVLGYVAGLFFKSSLPSWITLKLPSLQAYLTSTFVPADLIDGIRFITVAGPFALMGAIIGLWLSLRRAPVQRTVEKPEDRTK